MCGTVARRAASSAGTIIGSAVIRQRAAPRCFGELSTRSDEFPTRWANHNVRFHRTGVKHLHHSVVGDLELSYEAREMPTDPGLTMFGRPRFRDRLRRGAQMANSLVGIRMAMVSHRPESRREHL